MCTSDFIKVERYKKNSMYTAKSVCSAVFLGWPGNHVIGPSRLHLVVTQLALTPRLPTSPVCTNWALERPVPAHCDPPPFASSLPKTNPTHAVASRPLLHRPASGAANPPNPPGEARSLLPPRLLRREPDAVEALPRRPPGPEPGETRFVIHL